MAKSNSSVTTIDDKADQAYVAAAVAATIVGKNHDDALSGERRLITIHPTNEEGGSDAVPVGLNGYMYQIPRGVPCNVPVEVIEIIKNAKTTIMQTAIGGGFTERDAQRFAFSLE